jgi:hypothetical protein
MFNRLKKIIESYLDRVATTGPRYDKVWLLTPFMIPLFVFFFSFVILASNFDNIKHWYLNLTHPNSIEVVCNGDVDESQVEIKWSFDEFVEPITIWKNGDEVYLDFKNSGNNIFTLFVNDSLISRHNQYKDADWLGYTYVFEISAKDTVISVGFETR